MLTTEGVPIGNVSFAPGTINHWHVHHKGGQILLVTGGRGWYQEWGKEAQELHPGDVLWQSNKQQEGHNLENLPQSLQN